MTTIEVTDPQAEARLLACARFEGIDLATVVERLAIEHLPAPTISEPDTPDMVVRLPGPPYTILDDTALASELLDAIDRLESGSGIEVTPEYWARKEQRVAERLGAK